MERDPHQLIEGLLICCYAVGAAQAFLYVRGEMALAQERIAAALNEAYDAGYVGREHLRHRLLRDIVLTWGAGAYIVGEETALIESLEGERGMPRPQAAVLPGGHRPVPAADDRQQRRDAVQPPVDHDQRRRRVRRPRRRDVPGHAHVRRVRPRPAPRRLRGRVRRHHVPRPDLRPASTAAASAATAAQGVHPRRRLRPMVLRGASRPAAGGGRRGQGGLDARLRGHHRDGRDHRRGQGVPSGRALLRQGVVRQVHALP